MKRLHLLLLLTMLAAGCARGPMGVDLGDDLPLSPTPSPTATPIPRLATLPSEQFTKKLDGKKVIPGDPVNMVLVGSEAAVHGAILKAGWIAAEPITFQTSLRMANAFAFNLPYPNSPMSPLALFDREQDVGYQKNSADVRKRDHFRIWKTPVRDPQGRQTWAIAATKDIKVRIISGPTHVIDPKIDEERAYVATTLLETQLVTDRYEVPSIGRPYQGKNGEGDPYETDGMAHVLVVNESAALAAR